ncbi:MAG: O-antigen biosynthesis protein, partial [Actinomycetota bacterium]|nr:O-antigen biosynthesis protein [Actinomycetota bacterium]
MKVNLGCGHSYIDGWVNVDANPDVRADIYLDAFEFVREYGPEIEELYMGHFLEHLLPASAAALLSLIGERLPEGAQVSAVVPDMRAIFAAYDAGEITNSELNERFVYSYSQPSRHVWCYDSESLVGVFDDAGFLDAEPIDALSWEPVFWKDGPESRWQCGARATVPAAGNVRPFAGSSPVEEFTGSTEPVVATDELLLHRIRQLRAEVEGLRSAAGDSSATPAAVAPPTMFDRLPAPLVPMARAFLRDGSKQRRLARFGVDAARTTRSYAKYIEHEWDRVGFRESRTPSYRSWLRGNGAGRSALAAQRTQSARAVDPIRVEVVVLPGDAANVRHTLGSLHDQSWTHWVAHVLGEETPDGYRSDHRIHLRRIDDSDVWGAARAVLDHEPTRDFVVFLEAGDTLQPDCLFEVASTARRDPFVDLVYWDDDVAEPGRRGHDPQFRPAWSPDYLLSTNYVGRSFAVRHRRQAACGGIGGGPGEARYWDLVLRCGFEPGQVERVARVLSHLVHRPEASAPDAVEVVAGHLEREGAGAMARFERGAVRVVPPADATPSVSIVIPTRHNRELIGRCLSSISATDAPNLEIIVIDNGGRTDANEQWYKETFPDLDLRVEWWTQPFNYSAVNNLGASLASNEVLVFLNDDTQVTDRKWLLELGWWATRPGIGLVGAQLIGPDGEIQHGGVILGMNGFADHLFQGMAPDSPSLFGPTTSYRDVLSVTAACVAVQRTFFEELGGFDERFELCGSDVALGIDAVIAGRRNVCTPFAGVHHLESATRGTNVPPADFFASYWRYQRWVSGGDPYFSPNLSIASRRPALRSPHERTAADRMSETLGRAIKVFRMQNDAAEAAMLATTFRATDADARAVQATHELNRAPQEPKTINWFLPDIDSPFYGGVNTVLRLADHLAVTHGVENRFVFWAAPNEAFFRSAITAAFPSLAHSPIVFHDASRASLELVPPADAAVATLWATAYSVAQFPAARRKFYMIQDFEPMFYPAGTSYALAEESYRLGLYG